MSRRTPITLTALLGAGIVLAPLSPLATQPPASADETLLSTTSPVVVAVPAPGHSVEWSLSAKNVSSHAVAVSALVTGVGGDAFAGAHPLELSVEAPSGTPLELSVEAPSGTPLTLPAGSAVAAATSLGIVQPGATIQVHGRTALPREAGDEYQGVSGRMSVSLIGEDRGGAPAQPGDDVLAHTGLSITGIAATAAALLGAGLFFLFARRRRRRRRQPVLADAALLSSTDPEVKP